MNHHDSTVQQRAQDLTRLARALYEAALHEEDKERLEILKRIARELNRLINGGTSFQTDLGMDLLLFIDIKADGSEGRKESVATLELMLKRRLDWAMSQK